MSSRHLFELRKLKAKKNLITLQDCFMDEEETRKTILRIFDIFGLEKFIGEINCMNIINWVMKHLNLMYFTKQSSLETFPRIPNFVYKKASFASAFRAKNVMKQSSPSEKRTIQISIVNNLKAGLCWWTLIALRQIMIPIRDGNVIHNVWRYRYLIILKQEVNKFKNNIK
uniref:Uncharacterized protein n=1 Tax=Caenorhabditis tropicalis TaxID=1561998 RepID=A0A1I7UY83_9PELO